ncbi:MAG: bifunctional riboflavin kinase/FAD synthetase [Bdellovibrionales bacterium]|nr:bifunctional riboflavin kinase/FAD synthetase [Bdellovibrionales bacterium]
MQIFYGVEKINHPFDKCALALGNFDGFHLGHKELIKLLLKKSVQENLPAVVFTFSPHPAQVLKPQILHEYLCSKEDLALELQKMGTQTLIIQPFTSHFSQLSPLNFIEKFLIQPLHPNHIVIGHDFKFGKARQGSTETLASYSKQYKYTLSILDPIYKQGIRISSSHIRQFIRSGQVDKAHELLGRPYNMMFPIVKGTGRGTPLGFSTLNSAPIDLTTSKYKQDKLTQVIPKTGVYFTQTTLNMKIYPSITNVGFSPTFGDTGLRIETHLLKSIEDQSPPLGQQMKVEFYLYHREEMKFDSKSHLRAQIEKDVKAATNWWKI